MAKKKKMQKQTLRITILGGAEGQKKPEKKGGYDTNEMAVLQEMMSEFFG